MLLNEEFIIPSDEGVKSPTAPWPPRLAFDMAMGDDPESLMSRYSLGPSQFQFLCMNPVFLKEVSDHKNRIVEEGVSFKYKAKLQAETYLQNVDELIHDPDASPAVRLDAIKSVVKWAGYETEPKNAPSGGNQTRLVICWGDGSGQIALETTNTNE